jgi:outer membrane protein TolC
MNDYIRKAERDLAAATADIGVAESQALRAQVKTTQETLALSIGSYKDGQSSLLDVLDASVRPRPVRPTWRRRCSKWRRTMSL